MCYFHEWARLENAQWFIFPIDLTTVYKLHTEYSSQKHDL